MASASSNSSEESPPEPEHRSRPPDRVVVLVVIGLVLLSALWAIRAPSPSPSAPQGGGSETAGALSPERIPLVTGEEPIADMFIKAGCTVCHTIPGIPGANGQVGPVLILGATGAERLGDPSYKGEAKTVREYVVESVVDPRRFVVPGYPALTMPTWYGEKLSALALEKIAAYLEQQTGAR